jgi:hypothetical protein
MIMADKKPVLKKHIRDQLAQLAKRPIHYGAFLNELKNEKNANTHEQRNLLCLEWPGIKLGEKSDNDTTLHNIAAKRLGIYAKWIVAIDLLIDEGQDLADFFKVPNESVRCIFGDKNLGNPGMYFSIVALKASDYWSPIFCKIIELLKETYPVNKDLSFEEFKTIEIPLSDPDYVGQKPLTLFSHWIKTGYHPDKEISNSGKKVYLRHAKTKEIYSKLTKQVTVGTAHKLIANIYSDDLHALAHFGEELRNEITEDSEKYVCRPISLGVGASRQSVLKKIAGDDERKNKNLDMIGERLVDLGKDLIDIRRILTSSSIILIFYDWDNQERNFSALHNYLCNTNWAELLRALAQPLQESVRNVLSDPFNLSYRILILSKVEVTELTPWMNFSEPLDNDFINTYKKFSNYSNEIPELQNNNYSIVSSYPIKDNIEISLKKHMLTNYNADILNVDKSGNISFKSDLSDEKARQRILMKNWFFNIAERYDSIIIKLVLIGVSGIRKSTLRRCMEQLNTIDKELYYISNPAKLDKLIDQCLKRHTFLVEVEDEEVEGLPTEIRDLELDRIPHAIGGEHKKVSKERCIRFCNQNWEFIFSEIWVEARKAESNQSKDIIQSQNLAHKKDWSYFNFVLADETLRQSAAQMKHFEAEALDNPYTTRRVAQAIIHGLMSLDVLLPISNLNSQGLLYTGFFPADPDKRYRYLFSFLYRHCIEANAFVMGRSHGRWDIRFELLQIFINPKNGSLIFSPKDSPTSYKNTIPLPYTIPEPPLLKMNAELRCEILVAFGKAGLEIGTNDGRCGAKYSCSLLPGWRLPFQADDKEKRATITLIEERADINELLPSRNSTYYYFANKALKIRIDLLQMTEKENDLYLAKKLCDEQLARIGIGSEIRYELARITEKIFTSIDDQPGDVVVHLINDFHALHLKLEKKIGSKDVRQNVADIYSRLAKVIATEADKLETGVHNENNDTDKKSKIRKNVTSKFAEAFGLYWLGDRARSASASDDVGGKWAMAGARTMRSYVRVTLKLARLVIEDKGLENNVAWALAEGLLEHSQNRLGMYTRHHFRFRRERVAILLLEAARLRNWVRLNLAKLENILQKKMEKIELINEKWDERKQVIKNEFTDINIQIASCKRKINDMGTVGRSRYAAGTRSMLNDLAN